MEPMSPSSLILKIVSAVDEVENKWEHGAISGFRPQLISHAAIEAAREWYKKAHGNLKKNRLRIIRNLAKDKK